MGAASATSGVLTQLQGQIFALLYVHARPLSLEEIATELEQSKSNISVTIRGLLDWHLVRRIGIAGSRKDYYEAATDLWHVMQSIMERRFRWNLRQVLATVAETRNALAETKPRGTAAAERERSDTVAKRLEALHDFCAATDATIGAFAHGGAFTVDTVDKRMRVVPSADAIRERTSAPRRTRPLARPRGR
jgi:DNA-binding transcriptional regulator GbsR (MarR family)